MSLPQQQVVRRLDHDALSTERVNTMAPTRCKAHLRTVHGEYLARAGFRTRARPGGMHTIDREPLRSRSSAGMHTRSDCDPTGDHIRRCVRLLGISARSAIRLCGRPTGGVPAARTRLQQSRRRIPPSARPSRRKLAAPAPFGRLLRATKAMPTSHAAKPTLNVASAGVVRRTEPVCPTGFFRIEVPHLCPEPNAAMHT